MELLHNSMPFNPLRHPMCRRTSNPSSQNIKLFSPLPMEFLLPMVFITIPFPLSSSSFPPIFVPIIIPFPKKMKLRKFLKNLSPQVLFVLVQTPTLLLWSWSLRNKVLGTCVLTSVPSTNSPLKTNFPFLSLMTSWMNSVVPSSLLNLIFVLATTRYI
jgi:hypothetical protein